MKETRTSTHYKFFTLTIILMATAVFIIGCGGEATEAANTIAMQPELEPTAAMPTPTEETAVLPTEEPELDECLACHTDKDQLIKTADPVVEVISENEGEG